jgi:hypothetical protein
MGEGVGFETDELDHAISGAGDGPHAIAPGGETMVGGLFERDEA